MMALFLVFVVSGEYLEAQQTNAFETEEQKNVVGCLCSSPADPTLRALCEQHTGGPIEFTLGSIADCLP